ESRGPRGRPKAVRRGNIEGAEKGASCEGAVDRHHDGLRCRMHGRTVGQGYQPATVPRVRSKQPGTVTGTAASWNSVTACAAAWNSADSRSCLFRPCAG